MELRREGGKGKGERTLIPPLPLSPFPCHVPRRIPLPRFLEPLEPQQARLAMAAGGSIGRRVVAGGGEPEVHSQIQPPPDDLRLAQRDERRVNPDFRAFDSRAGGEVRHSGVGRDVLGPAVGIAAVVEGVGPKEDVPGAEGFGPREREGEEDRVPGRHVGGRDTLPDPLRRRVLGHRDVAGEGGSAEGAEIQVHDHVSCDGQSGRNPAGRLELDRVALAVPHAQGVDLEALAARHGGGGGGVHAAAQEHHGAGGCHAPKLPPARAKRSAAQRPRRNRNAGSSIG
jgi:hypothetical protein